MTSPNDVTFIIPVYNLEEYRIRNLKYILPYIIDTGCQVVVAEQNITNVSNLSDILREYPTVKHAFYFTQEKRFHKTGLINYAVKNHVDTKYAWVNDVDFYMKFKSVFGVLWTSRFIQPYEIAKKLNERDSETLITGQQINVDFTDSSVKYISLYSALSFIFHVEEFLSIGGMDETIYGWGYEDIEFSKRVKEKYYVQKMNFKGIHLWHPVENLELTPVEIPGASVVLICHEKYLPILQKTIESIDRQTKPFVKKILSLDGCMYRAPAGWTILSNDYKHPNLVRNAGLNEVNTEWVIFWDADNFMPVNYHAEMSVQIQQVDYNVAFLYPSIIYVDKDQKMLWQYSPPEWEYWLSREKTFIDTSGAWRTFALQTVGGWSKDTIACDDYEMATRLTRNNWVGKKSKVYTQITLHSGSQRSQSNKLNNPFWNIWSLGIITLWGDRTEVISEVIDWYKNTDIPKNTSIYWVNNTNDPIKTKVLSDAAIELKSKYKYVTLIEGGPPYSIAKGESYHTWKRHQHVANLYNDVLSRANDDLILFVEDDNIPPYDGLRKLHNELIPSKHMPETVGYVGGAYRARTTPQYVCGATSKVGWSGVLDFDSLPKVPMQIGVMGGGFTLYRNSALKKAMPVMCTKDETGRLIHGWDGNLGIKLNELGYKLILHGGVRVQHKCMEVNEWEKRDPSRKKNQKIIPSPQQYEKMVIEYPHGFRPNKDILQSGKNMFDELMLDYAINGKFLDIGCGTGRLAFPCLYDGIDYYGFDCDKLAVDFCKSTFGVGNFYHIDIHNNHCNPNGTLSMDAIQTTFQDTKFDSFAAYSLLPHLGSQTNVSDFIRNLAAITLKGSFGMITSLVSPFNEVSYNEKRSCYDKKWLFSEMEKYFTIVKTKKGESTNRHDQMWIYLERK